MFLCVAFLSLPIEYTALIIGAGVFLVAAALSPMGSANILLILAPLQVLIQTELAADLPIDLAQGLFTLLLGSLLIDRTRFAIRTIPISISKPVLVFAPYIIVVSLSLLTAFSNGTWLREWLKWLVVILLAAVIPSISSKLKWQYLVFGLSAAALANALIGIYIFFGGSGALHLVINDRFFRAFGTFGQPNPFGGFMGLIAPLTMMAAFGYGGVVITRLLKSREISIAELSLFTYYAITSAVIVLALFMSWSRGAWLGFFVSGFAMIVALPRKRWQSIVVVIFVVVSGVFVWNSGLLPGAIVNRISSATDEIFVLSDVRAVDIDSNNYAIVERLAHWQAALNMNRSHFWLGVGAGNYEVAYESFRLLNWQEPLGHAHNYYLNVLAETGIIGLVAYGTAILGILGISIQARKHPDFVARSVIIGLLGTWIYLIVHSLTDNLFVNNMFVHFGVMLGILATLHIETTSVVRT